MTDTIKILNEFAANCFSLCVTEDYQPEHFFAASTGKVCQILLLCVQIWMTVFVHACSSKIMEQHHVQADIQSNDWEHAVLL